MKTDNKGKKIILMKENKVKFTRLDNREHAGLTKKEVILL